MAKKLELSDPHVVALMGQQRKLIPWQSAAYNDEITLLELRAANPKAEWSLIRNLFNEAVPCKRERSMDSIKNKWRVLKAKSQTALQATLEHMASGAFAEDSTAMQVASATQMNPEGYLESPSNTFIGGESVTVQAGHTLCDAMVDNQYSFDMSDQSVASLDAMNQNFANHFDMISTHWDRMADFDGYLASFENDLERMEAVRVAAMQAAFGMRF